MADTTARFALPYLAAGQAQKELFHNEALALIDAALHPLVVAMGRNDPPAAPAPGQCWIVGAAPTDAWAGHALAIAMATVGGWRFVAPTTGMTVWLASDNLPARWTGSAWTVGEIAAAHVVIGGLQVIGPRLAAIAAPTGGSTVDASARAALTLVIAALRTHGLID